MVTNKRRRLRRKKPIWDRANSELTPKQRRLREKSLNLTFLIRRGLNPAAASKLAGIDIATAQKNTNAFYKIRGRWQVKKVDHVSRPMLIYEDSRKVTVEINDSRTANLIGVYHNRVKQYVNTYNPKWLKLRRKSFRDRRGKRHVLETRPLIVIALKAMERHPEFFDIYRW